MKDYMSDFVRQLHAHSEESRRLYKLRQEADAQAKLTASIQVIKRTKPLEDQIVELMRTLPPQLRDRPWSMADLVHRLTGKYRDRPSAKCVGDALRRLRWSRERRYADGYDGRRVWLPPD